MIIKNQAEFNTAMQSLNPDAVTVLELQAGAYTWPWYAVRNVTVKALGKVTFASIGLREGSANITLDGLNFAAPAGILLRATDVDGLTVRKCTFTGGRNQIWLLRVKNFAIVDNDMSDVTLDYIFIGDCHNGTIARNQCRFWHYAPGEHADGIQLYTSAVVKPCSNLKIFDNLFEAKPDKRPQGAIFLRSEAGTSHTDINIWGNLMCSIGWNDIWSQFVQRLTIHANRVLFEPYAPDLGKPDSQTVKRGHIVVLNGDAEVTNNIAGQFIGGTQSGNTIEVSHTAVQIAAAVAEWRAKFRAPALTLEQRVERLEKLAGLLP